MEIGKQIKQNRQRLNLSQEELANKVYVTRQTISNWENQKNYPDIHSLVLLSTVFHVSVDDLIKGDIGKMKEEINLVDVEQFKKETYLFGAMFVGVIVSSIPLFMMGWLGIAIWFVLFIITFLYADHIEKRKKQYDIQTYKEITAFIEGNKLDEIEKAQEKAKRPYQTILYVLGCLVGAAVFTYVTSWIISTLF